MPALCEDLLSSVDQPLKIARDKQTGKDYLLCDYNRDGDSYRYVESVILPINFFTIFQTRLWNCPHFSIQVIAFGRFIQVVE